MAAGDTLVTFFPRRDECKQRGSYFVSQFDYNKTTIFSCIVPRNYAGGGITVYLHWSARAVEGTIGWLVAIQPAENLNTDAFGDDNIVTADDVGENKGDIVITSIDIPDPDNHIVAGEILKLRIKRGDGTCLSVAELIAIEVRETPTSPPP